MNKSNFEKTLEDYNIQTGDLLYWGTSRGRIYHATIISDVTDTDILYAGNTDSRFDESLIGKLEGDDITVHIIRLNDELFDDCD